MAVKRAIPQRNPEMTKHTPGTWEEHRDEDAKRLEVRVPANAGFRVIATVERGFDDRAGAEQDANARLIVAAPELLALVKRYGRACLVCDANMSECETCCAARILVDRIEGRKK